MDQKEKAAPQNGTTPTHILNVIRKFTKLEMVIGFPKHTDIQHAT